MVAAARLSTYPSRIPRIILATFYLIKWAISLCAACCMSTSVISQERDPARARTRPLLIIQIGRQDFRIDFRMVIFHTDIFFLSCGSLFCVPSFYLRHSRQANFVIQSFVKKYLLCLGIGTPINRRITYWRSHMFKCI